MTRIAHWGTFEVANTGDLLFALVLEKELGSRLPGVEIDWQGPLGGTAPMGLDRRVGRISRFEDEGFWQQAKGVDAFVLGGGELGHAGSTLVRTDKGLQRIDFWPFVSDLGALAGVRPVAWNAVGVPVDIPEELAPALREALHDIDLLTVRDEHSRDRLLAAGVERDIDVTPDTGVLVESVIDRSRRRAAVDRLRAQQLLPPAAGRPLVVAHFSFLTPTVTAEAAAALRLVRDEGADLVLLAVGPTHGDGEGLTQLAAAIGGPVTVLADPDVVEVVAVLELADAVVTTSYHAALLATVLGRPAALVRHRAHQPSKLSSLAAQLGRERWLVDRPDHLPEVVARLLAGEGPADQGRVDALIACAREHLDRVADVVTRVRGSNDLDERSAAHRAALGRLITADRRTASLRVDVALLRDHLDRAVARATEVEAAFWRASVAAEASPLPPALDLEVMRSATLQTDPYEWGHVGPLFDGATASALADGFPLDDAEERGGGDGRRTWSYRVRPLVMMGGASAARPAGLDPVWHRFADSLLSPAYREEMTRLTGVDLTDHALEANCFSYPVGSYQDPHPDLPEKVVTHVMWFNRDWAAEHGGCLRILRSSDPSDVAEELLPLLGWSAVFVRSHDSWHSVPPVAPGAPGDRRAVVATFHLPGSRSSMWS